jgi:uncharacterized membrane protein
MYRSGPDSVDLNRSELGKVEGIWCHLQRSFAAVDELFMYVSTYRLPISFFISLIAVFVVSYSAAIGTVTSGTSSSGHDVLPIAISFGVLGGLLLLAAIVGLAILYYRKKKEALMLVIMSAPEKTFYNQDYVGTPKEVGADPKPSPA